MEVLHNADSQSHDFKSMNYIEEYQSTTASKLKFGSCGYDDKVTNSTLLCSFSSGLHARPLIRGRIVRCRRARRYPARPRTPVCTVRIIIWSSCAFSGSPTTICPRSSSSRGRRRAAATCPRYHALPSGSVQRYGR